MDAQSIRSASWRELNLPAAIEQGYVIWTAPEVPGIARIARDGCLYWRFGAADYADVSDLVDAYNTRLRPPMIITEAAVRAALAAQLSVAPSAIPNDSAMLAGMRRALEVYIKMTI